MTMKWLRLAYLQALSLARHVCQDCSARLEGLLKHALAVLHIAHGLRIIIQQPGAPV